MASPDTYSSFSFTKTNQVVSDCHSGVAPRRHSLDVRANHWTPAGLFLVLCCTGCHNMDQSKFVPPFIVPMKTIFPGDNPLLLAQRMPPLNPVLNTADSIFDDKMAVVNASLRGEERGIALPLLLDLGRKSVFLHDNSVPTLDNLLSPSRGPMAPHPFYLSDARQRTPIGSSLKNAASLLRRFCRDCTVAAFRKGSSHCNEREIVFIGPHLPVT